MPSAPRKFIPTQDAFRFLVDVLSMYTYALLFGASALGTIIVKWSSVPYLAAATLAAGWLLWKVHFRIAEFLLTWALVIMVEEELVEIKHEPSIRIYRGSAKQGVQE